MQRSRFPAAASVSIPGRSFSHQAGDREFNVSTSKEVLEVDENSWIGKLLARGVAGFFQEEQGFGAIMGELERVYSASRTSGGTRDAVQKALEELCAKGILDRQQKANQWVYRESAEFKERVRKA